MKQTLTLAAAAFLLFAGFLFGKHHQSDIPQGVILNSGPGLAHIQAVTEEFVDAWNRQDFQASTNTYAEDAVFMFPGLPVMHGREAIKAFEEDGREADPREMEISEQVDEVIYFDEWSVMRGTGKFKIHNDDSSTEESTFKWAMLSKRSAAGNWESVWDILNFDS